MKYLIASISVFTILTFFKFIFIIPLTLLIALFIYDRVKEDFLIKLSDENKKRIDLMQEKLNVIVLKLGIK